MNEQRVFPVETGIDVFLSRARRVQGLYGYKPGRVEDYYFQHRFEFVRNDPEGAPDVQTYSFQMGGAAVFEWLGVAVHGDDITQLDSGTGPFKPPFILLGGPFGWNNAIDAAAWFDVSFWSLGGTRPHQSAPYRAALLRGNGPPFPSAVGPGAYPYTEGGIYGLPYWFDEPTFISANDSIRVDVANNLNTSNNPALGSVSWRVDVLLFGIRYYRKRT